LRDNSIVKVSNEYDLQYAVYLLNLNDILPPPDTPESDAPSYGGITEDAVRLTKAFVDIFDGLRDRSYLYNYVRFKAKTLIGVPTLYRMILEHDRIDFYDLSSLKYCFNGGDVLPLEINERWRKKFQNPIYQGYGATETCGGVSMCPTDQKSPPTSMGKVLASKQIKLVAHDSLEPVSDGQPGEILVHSEKMVTQYWNKPEETAASFVEIDGVLWYRTADIVTRDEDGYLYFVDRTVDTIKHKGYRVSSSEIESALQEHQAVVGACAVGIPDPKVGERIKAFVVLKEDVKGITGYDLIKWCRGRLAGYKVPQYIEFRDMLPKSKVGKLLRREIRSEESRRAEK
jgi:long-chain acyl-CoA synthetase